MHTLARQCGALPTLEAHPDLTRFRSRTRRRLHEPRPVVSHETRKRIGQWKAEIKQAAKARHIRPVDRLYAFGTGETLPAFGLSSIGPTPKG